jgi:hypothetical protein
MKCYWKHVVGNIFRTWGTNWEHDIGIKKKAKNWVCITFVQIRSLCSKKLKFNLFITNKRSEKKFEFATGCVSKLNFIFEYIHFLVKKN